MFLYVELDAGLLFARLSQTARNPTDRYLLKTKSETARDTVERFIPRVSMPDGDRERLLDGLQILKREIGKVPT
jgi:hypothetical protein